MLPLRQQPLDMLMQRISLADELTIKKSNKTALYCDDMPIDKNNTVLVAAELFFAAIGITSGAEIMLKKNIPSQAGLGGGSSDAAAVLCALNTLFDARLTKNELMQIGLRIGADVPFFIVGGSARAQGIGEKLVPFTNNCDFSYLLIKPQSGVSTAAAYKKYHELGIVKPNITAAQNALEAGNAHEYFRTAQNALMPAGIALCPQVGEILTDCAEYSADFAMMTGSGSCVFAVFSSEPSKQNAHAAFTEKYPFCAKATNK
ncbi:MAG: 4-(cytidine 5'-diphospho)-2-C-methyl-D-erythritol kinase [Christensenella sp.]